MRKILLTAAAALLVFSGCATSPSAVNGNPDNFRSASFTISGKVEQALTLPGTTVTAFLLGDGQSTLVALSFKQRVKDESVSFQARLLGLASGPAPLGSEEKALLKSILLKNKLVADPFLDLTVNAIEGALGTLGMIVKKLYFVLEV